MADILTFRLRPKHATADRLAPQQQVVTVPRVDLEEAAHATLDAADKLIALLDRIDGDPDLEDGEELEPSPGAPEGHASQVGYFRGGAHDIERGTEPAA